MNEILIEISSITNSHWNKYLLFFFKKKKHMLAHRKNSDIFIQIPIYIKYIPTFFTFTLLEIQKKNRRFISNNNLISCINSKRKYIRAILNPYCAIRIYILYIVSYKPYCILWCVEDFTFLGQAKHLYYIMWSNFIIIHMFCAFFFDYSDE